MTVSTTPALAAVKAMLFDALQDAWGHDPDRDKATWDENEGSFWRGDPANGKLPADFIFEGPGSQSWSHASFDADKLAATVLAWSDARHAEAQQSAAASPEPSGLTMTDCLAAQQAIVGISWRRREEMED